MDQISGCVRHLSSADDWGGQPRCVHTASSVSVFNEKFAYELLQGDILWF